MNLSSGDLNICVVCVPAFITFLFIVFWMMVAWRAMRAHESLASATRQLAEEIRHWRRSSEERLAPEAPSPSVSAAEEVRASEMLMDRKKNA